MIRSIGVLMTPDLLSPGVDLSQTCAIVIDVLRATSVMATAGHAGVASIATCRDVQQARELAASMSLAPLLCGERQCKPIPGFDLGNSPSEYTPQVVKHREMILTTTNGTRAINSVMSSRRLLTASFLNLQATIQAVRFEEQLRIVCAGTDGQVSFEDVLLAGAIVDRFGLQETSCEIDDSARIARSAWRQATATNRTLRDSLGQSLGGRNLIAAGYEADLERCAQIDTIPGIVQRLRPGESVFEYRMD